MQKAINAADFVIIIIMLAIVRRDAGSNIKNFPMLRHRTRRLPGIMP